MVEHNTLQMVEQNTLEMVEQNTLQMVEQNTFQMVEQNTLLMVNHPLDGWTEHPLDGLTPSRRLNTLQMVEPPCTLIQLNQCRVQTADDESCDIPIKIIYSLRTVPSQMRLETGL